jgi:YidC/Oxa1 family membrane protein insertase
MSPPIRRLVITLAVLILAGGIVATMFMRSQGAAPQQTPDVASGKADDEPATPPPKTPADQESTEAPRETEPAETAASDEPPAPETPPAAQPETPLTGLRALAPPPTTDTPAPLGSLDPEADRMLVTLTPRGAGIASIAYGDIWETALAGQQARDHRAALAQGRTPETPLPDEKWRYVLQTEQPYRWESPKHSGFWKSFDVPIMAARRIEVDGQPIELMADDTWAVTGDGQFGTRIVDDEDRSVLELTRTIVLEDETYDLRLEQRVRNVTDPPRDVTVRWVQYGPVELRVDRARYIDRRRFRMAYWPLPQLHPDIIHTDETDFIWEHNDLIKRSEKVEKELDPLLKAQLQAELQTLWPSPTALEEGWAMAWFASTNRYFAMAVYPLTSTPGAFEETVAEIRVSTPGGAEKEARVAFTTLYSPLRTVEPGAEAVFDLGVYAGPLERSPLTDREPHASLRMRGLILYQMSTFCAMCTFQWLAEGLLWFLALVHGVFGDWAIAIIILVIVVRTILHPITKKSQVNIQRFTKVMTELRPEIEKLQKKYPDDPRKLQAEQMKMMRERGVNPFHMLGCLPMFLQMPIWVALYAMLYFAFELRQEPAFWGVFQLFGNWQFLADLSAADHCLWVFDEPFKFWFWNVTGINVLPILMGLVFYFQQKYMSPPPSPTMTKEQIQQQKIMKVMMVVMFPLMLYSAPSGLTLYIFTSSAFGIIEGRYIRKHIKDLEMAPPKPKAKKKKPRGPQARAFADAIERAKRKKQPPQKKFKRRK